MLELVRGAYESVYGPIYELSLKYWHGDHRTASFLAASSMSTALVMNMANVVVGVIAWHGPVRAGAALKVLIWAGVLMIYGFNYVFFVHQQRYVRVHDEFRRRGIGTRKCLRVIAWTYLIGSFVMPVVLGFLFLLD